MTGEATHSGTCHGPLLFWALLCAWFALSPTLLFADTSAETGPTPLVISYRLDSAPLQFRSDDGEADGLLIDLWRLWSKKSGIPVRFAGAFNQEARDMLRDGRADINAGLFQSDKRAESLDFSEPILRTAYHLYRNASLTDIGDNASALAQRVGVTRGSFHENYLRRQHPNTRLVLYDGYEQLFNAAVRGDVQVFVTQPLYLRHYLQEHGIAALFHRLPEPLYTRAYHAAVTKGRSDLLRTINEHMRKITRDERQRLSQKWLGAEWVTDKPATVRLHLTPAEKQWLAEHPVVEIGADGSWPPVDFVDDQGRFRGIAADYLNAISERLGIQLKPRPGPSFKSMLERLMNGELKVGATVTHTEERAAKLLFSAPFFTVKKVIVTRREQHGPLAARDLSGKTVAVEEGYYTAGQLASLYPWMKLRHYRHSEDALRAVSLGEADAYIGNQAVAQWLIEKQQLTNLHFSGDPGLPPAPQRFAVVKEPDWAPFAGILDKALASLSDDERHAIDSRWVGVRRDIESPSLVQLSEAERRWLAAHPDIRLGVDPEWPPVEYIDLEGRYRGMASEVISLLNDRLGLNLEPEPGLSWPEVLSAAERGEVDVVSAATSSAQRDRYLVFTEPYLRFPLVIYTRLDTPFIAGLQDLNGKLVAVEKNYIAQEMLALDHPKIKLVSVNNTLEALQLLSQGGVDAYVGNLAIGGYLISEHGLANLKVAAPTDYSNDLRIGVRKDWPELRNILQKGLDSIQPGEMTRLRQKWMAVRFERQVDYRLLWRLGIGAAIVLGAVVLWAWLRERRRQATEHHRRRLELTLQSAYLGGWDLEIGDDGGMLIQWNRNFALHHGYAPSVEQGGPHDVYAHIREEDRERVQQAFDDYIAGRRKTFAEEYATLDERWIFAQGQTFEHRRSGQPKRIIGISQDITKRKRMEEELRTNEQQLLAILDSIPITVTVTRPDGGFLFVNRFAAEEIGVDQNDLEHINAADFYADPEQRAALLSQLHREGHIDQQELTMRSARYGVVDALVSFVPFLFGGQPAILGVLVNISDRKNIERALAEAKERAEDASQFKSRFLANMSHEIRTPMNAVIGLNHLMLQTELDSAQRDYARKIQLSAETLLNLLNDILDFSRIEAGRLQIEETSFQLDELLAHIADMVGLRAQEKGLEFLFHVDTDIPQYLIGDPHRITQVLINLCHNAIKFTEAGEIVVHVELLARDDRSVRLRFEVSDTGIGIDEDILPRLFDSFSQADETTSRRFGGSGLGLAISKQLVELMGGQISVASTPGRGSSFSFTLPLQQQEEQPELQRQLDIDTRQVRVLVADDNPAARQILVEMLRGFRFQAEAVDSGEAALKRLSQAGGDTQEKTFDVLLLDWKMPGMDGLETVSRIHGLDGMNKLPSIIMVTAFARDELLDRLPQNQVDDLLLKPVNPSSLLDAIAKAFGSEAVDPFAQSVEQHREARRLPLKGEVLLVEDNEINRQVAREILERFGLTVREAVSGLEALKKIEERRFDLVLMDIQMPDMDGFEACQLIRDDIQWKDLPIVAMTAHALAGDRERCLRAGMNEHVPKPIDPDLLYRTLRRWLPLRPSGTAIRPANSDDSNGLPKELPGLRLDWGLKRVGGNTTLFSRLLERFAQDHEQDIGRLRRALKHEDLELARRIAHTLQGVAANLGATRLEAATGEFLKKLRASGGQLLDDNLSQMEGEFDTVVQGIMEWHRQVPAPEPDKKPSGESTARLEQLHQLIVSGNPASVKKFVELKGELAEWLDSKDLERLHSMLNDYDFDEAEKLFQQALKNKAAE